MEGFKEWLAIKLAWLLPERLVMWCAYRVAAHATSGKWDTEWVPGLTFMDAIGRWGVSNAHPIAIEAGTAETQQAAPFTRARAEGIGITQSPHSAE